MIRQLNLRQYQAGPVDIIVVPGLASHVEFMHEMPGYTAFHRRLTKFARVVTFDKRGQGLSDRIFDAPSLEQRIDDVRGMNSPANSIGLLDRQVVVLFRSIARATARRGGTTSCRIRRKANELSTPH
jgi:biopolymer transport protein ExbB/TolQ